MSINWKELELILSELPLQDSYIQKITEHSWNAFTLSMFSREEKAWLLYFEIGTPHSRVNRTDRIRQKAKNTQRFTQYLKAHIIGRKVTAVRQLPFDRAFELTLSNSENDIKMITRLYSGPGANIIITDMENKIQEILYRRTSRGEFKGETLIEDERTSEGERKFHVRAYDEDISFNEAIDRMESDSSSSDKLEDLTRRAEARKERETRERREALARTRERLEKTKGFEEMKRSADLLSSSIYLVKKGMDRITLNDWETGGTITLPLDPSLSPNENLEHYYSRYRKDKKSAELAESALLEEEKKLQECEEYWDALIAEGSIQKLQKALSDDKESDSSLVREGKPGLYINSNGWTLVVGRNAKENDQILRNGARGSDLWMHTRDFAGGYVFIKAIRDKSVPLPVLLDAASLAIHFSKARKNGKADLYYTQVKYLRRIKGAKTGLIIPTQEKNLNATLDEERVSRLLGER